MRVKIKGLEFGKKYIVLFTDTERFFYEFVYTRKSLIRTKINYHDYDGQFVGDLNQDFNKKELKRFLKDDFTFVHEFEKGIEKYHNKFPLKK